MSINKNNDQFSKIIFSNRFYHEETGGELIVTVDRSNHDKMTI